MDVFGQALLDYFATGSAELLTLHNSYGEAEEMPVDIFFREEHDLPPLELQALKACRGRILDIGAGVGSHALILQNRGFEVVAMDNSAAAVKIMKDRGIQKTRHADFFNLINTSDKKVEQYDTLLFMMNGIGINGTLLHFREFLTKAHVFLCPGGQLLFDSSDISYLYDDQQMPANHYFGEVSYQYEYRGKKGAWFNWLYIDQRTLLDVANETGWACELLFDDREDQYLIRLKKNNS